MLSTEDYTGPHNFEVNVDSRSEGRNFLVSKTEEMYSKVEASVETHLISGNF
jgi:hypothetical protein